MTSVLVSVATLLGGLAFFMYGMSAMSDGLEQMAGGALERTLKKMTKSDFISFFLGAGITIAIQSSSAMTVMLVGLVNSGIVEFSNTFGMIMGSNVGTTLTAWLLSLMGISGDNFFLTLLNPETFAPILAFVGIVMRMISKKERKQKLGVIFIGFAVLMAGMQMMSTAVEGIKTMDGFDSFLMTLSSPIVALLVSTVFTGVIQSSAATIGIVQTLALSGGITYQMAIPLVLGANIGTCVTALISGVGTNKNAKRVVALHFSVNVIGSIICMIILYILRISGLSILGAETDMLGVAVIHTLFNVVTTVVLVPARKRLLKFCEFIIPDKDDKTHTVFLDERLFTNSTLAIAECKRLVNEMAVYTKDAMIKSIGLIGDYDEAVAKEIKEIETLTDKYEDRLGTYLVKLSSGDLSAADSHSVARMIHNIGDFERISDHALNVCSAALEIKEKKIEFSDDANKELSVISSAVSEILKNTMDSFANDDVELAHKVEPLEQVIDKLKQQLKDRHVERLQKGECTVQLGFVFNDIITNFERVSDHCSNIAVYTMQMDSPKLDTHKYLKGIKSTKNAEFMDLYRDYEEKYSID